jgi:flagellar basal body rod protein FlgB
MVGSNTAGSAQIERSQFFYGQDKNGVDMEQQIAGLAKNAGQFDTLTKIENKMLNSIRTAMKDS